MRLCPACGEILEEEFFFNGKMKMRFEEICVSCRLDEIIDDEIKLEDKDDFYISPFLHDLNPTIKFE